MGIQPTLHHLGGCLCGAALALSLSGLVTIAPASPEAEEVEFLHEMPPPPPREFRAAWITTVHNIDWPSREGLPSARQQQELSNILDLCRELRLNTVVLQVRSECDAFYPSKIEPFAPWLTGTMGRDPGYDPLGFAIEEARQRGLELHAWFNPFRAVNSKHGRQSDEHVSRTHPQELRRYGTKVWLDPTRPFARKRALAMIREVVANYDVDGVHLDDYFYPYPVKQRNGKWLPFPDDTGWASYQAEGGALGRDAWRRKAVNDFVEELYRMVKRLKPHCMVGLSPFGIWRPGYPEQVKNSLDSYHGIYADTRLWWQQGWMDYCAPQLYWSLNSEQYGFGGLYRWWLEENLLHRQLWPGIASYRIRSREDPKRKASESLAQIETVRKLGNGSSNPGHIHFSVKSLLENRDKLQSVLKNKAYPEIAVVPAMDWLGTPTLPRIKVSWRVPKGSSRVLEWEPVPADDNVRWWLIQSFRNGSWTTHSLLPRSTRQHSYSDSPEKLSIRSIAPSGHSGPATVIGIRKTNA